MMGTTQVSPSESTDLGLVPPRHHVDPRCRGWWLAQTTLSGLVVVLPIVLLGVLIGPARGWLLTVALVCAALTVAAMVLVPRVRWVRHRWEATDEAVYSRSGLIWEEWRAAPLSRIQTVDKTRGPLQRVFGLATVEVTTASSKGAVRISALDDQVAAQMVDRLTLLTEGDQRDAT